MIYCQKKKCSVVRQAKTILFKTLTKGVEIIGLSIRKSKCVQVSLVLVNIIILWILLLMIKMMNSVKTKWAIWGIALNWRFNSQTILDSCINTVLSYLRSKCKYAQPFGTLRTKWEEVSIIARAWEGPQNKAIDAQLYRLSSTPGITWEMSRSWGQLRGHRCGMSRGAYILKSTGGHILFKLQSPGWSS